MHQGRVLQLHAPEADLEGLEEEVVREEGAEEVKVPEEGEEKVQGEEALGGFPCVNMKLKVTQGLVFVDMMYILKLEHVL